MKQTNDDLLSDFVNDDEGFGFCDVRDHGHGDLSSDHENDFAFYHGIYKNWAKNIKQYTLIVSFLSIYFSSYPEIGSFFCPSSVLATDFGEKIFLLIFVFLYPHVRYVLWI